MVTEVVASQYWMYLDIYLDKIKIQIYNIYLRPGDGNNSKMKIAK
jgi:hypothetical protein